MSGTVYIMPTEFYDLTTKTKTLGFRIFDNTSHAYDNRWIDMPNDPLEILARVVKSDDYQVLGFLDDVCDAESDMIIGSKVIKFAQIRDIVMNND